jgi:asparagine synthase (glutamine-hydrolysing)
MCGIVGQVGGIASTDETAAVIERQLALLHHRGPDDAGTLVEAAFAFGHARLAIIDPEHGHQPFVSDDGALVITFNGEIYNYVELREELLAHGHAFRTTSDTEVLLTGYRHWGRHVVGRLDGMFAFAIYDRRARELFCARDPYGQKPFFYHVDGERFAFASECRAFAELPGFRPEVDRASIADFLAFEAFPLDRAIYRGVRKLPPGHCLRYVNGNVEIVPYFTSVPCGTDAAAGRATGAHIEDEVRAALREAVQRTFRADVPVGLLLSGGLDSSLVLALLREVHPAVPLATFTIRNVDPSYDESAAAATLARAFGARHTEVTAEPAVLARIASELPARLDEPQADPGILPKYLVCSEIAKTTKVALTGDGGDELFYGYAVFRAERLARLAKIVPGPVHRSVLQPLAQRLPASRRYLGLDLKLKQFTKGFPLPDHLRNFYWTSAFPDRELPRLLRDERQDFADVERQLDLMRLRWHKAGGPLGRLAYLYQQQYLPDYVLANSDRASMLNSVELRTPYLAPGLARLANDLPDAAKMRGGETKSLLRAIARKLLPAGIVDRPKIGFTAPVASLIAGELKPEILEFLGPAYLRRQGLFREGYVARLLAEHFANRHNHYKQIWVLFMLQKWLHARGIVSP